MCSSPRSTSPDVRPRRDDSPKTANGATSPHDSPRGRQTDLSDEALSYLRNGWSVIPIIPGTKRPPNRFTLSRYFERPATEREIRRWFANGPSSMAVCLGDVSDGLTCRDFDVAQSYQRWKTEHPRLAATLPTARTARGAHVYFTSVESDFGDRQIITGVDGELKRGGYTLLPRSIHPTGKHYEWLFDFDDAPFVSDLSRAGLLPAEHHATQEIFPPLIPNAVFGGLTIEQCIEATQPSGHGERHYCLFNFIRMLKATELADAAPNELQAPVGQWLSLARPRIRTKDWRTNWIEFLDGWKRVRMPYGATMTAIAEKATGNGIEQLESICRELQRIAGDKAFHLDCRTAGKVLGVHFTTANRWLQILCSGPMERVRKGDYERKRASEYRF